MSNEDGGEGGGTDEKSRIFKTQTQTGEKPDGK